MSQLTRLRKDFLSVLDFDPADFDRCLDVAAQLKADRPLGREAPSADVLAGRHVAMLFEKASLRTRSTFEIAIHELGGQVLMLRPDAALGGREPVADVARNLERWIDAVIIRTFSQRLLQEFAASAKHLHVINALTDDQHPCQALSDCLTLREHWGSLRGRTIAYVGDGNNVAASLAHAAAMAGAHLHVASPEGYQLSDEVVHQATSVARQGARLRLFADPADAVADADAVYTDTWTSMGQEDEADRRRRDFRAVPGQRRPDGARQARGALHALPARASRGRGHGRGLRVARIDRLRSGRESPALPESAAPDAARAGKRVAAAGGAKPTLKGSAYNL